ncbi:hypothetical protein L345_15839, partial [Ophiophagus hannah]
QEGVRASRDPSQLIQLGKPRKRRPCRRSSRRKGSQQKFLVDNQLQKVLQRRRRIVDQSPVLPELPAPAADGGLLPHVSRAREEDQAAVGVPRNPQPNKSNFSETSKDLPGEPKELTAGAPVHPRLKIAEVAWL